MTRIAFVSCAHPVLRPVQPAWDAIAAAKPDLLLLLGDTTYMSWDREVWHADRWQPDELSKNYALQFVVPGFRRLMDDASLPKLAIWDDHDFGWNDCVGSQLTPAQYTETRALFNHYLGSALNNNPPHLYCTHDIGPVRVIMLDVRTHRTLSTDPSPTVLGKDQEDWLWQQLAESPQPCTIVCSGSVINRGADGHKFRDYPVFHSRLMAELQHDPAAAKPRKILFLSGDIHDNRWKRWPGFYEATSSGVACWAPSNQHNAEIDNWGLIEFDTGSGLMTVSLEGHAPSYVGRHTVRLADWAEVT